MDNADYAGKVILGGGTLDMGNDAALGTGDLAFDGGTLRYGTGAVSYTHLDVYKRQGVYNRGETLPSGNLNYRGDIWMDISGGAFGLSLIHIL